MKPEVQVVKPLDWIVDMFRDYKRPKNSKDKYDLLVAVCGRLDSPGPRDSRWDYIRDMGMPLIEKVLNRKPIGAGPHFFIFPDRWMVPAEGQQFTLALDQNPDAKKFDKVYVVTNEPYIVSGCLKEQVRIVRKVD